MKKLQIAAKVAKSFLPTEGYKKIPPKTCIKVEMKRQWTPYSCTAAVLQMVANYYGVKMSHLAAIKRMNCIPEGAQLDEVACALSEYGLRTKTLNPSGVKKALKRGEPVITHDALSYTHDHAVLAIGATPKGFWIADPLVAEVRWVRAEHFFRSSEEWIAVGKE